MKKDEENQGKEKSCSNLFSLNNVRKLSTKERHQKKKKPQKPRNLLILYKLSCELIMKDFKQDCLPSREVEVPAVILTALPLEAAKPKLPFDVSQNFPFSVALLVKTTWLKAS